MRLDHVQVEDPAELRALAERLQSAGAPVRWDDRLPDAVRFYTADPFGNRLELLARAPGPAEDAERSER